MSDRYGGQRRRCVQVQGAETDETVIIENSGSVRNLVSRRPSEGVSSHSSRVSRTGSVINAEQFFLTPRVKSPFVTVLFLAAK